MGSKTAPGKGYLFGVGQTSLSAGSSTPSITSNTSPFGGMFSLAKTSAVKSGAPVPASLSPNTTRSTSMGPPAKRIKMRMSSFELPLKVIVGKEKAEFYIQKCLICSESGFFEAACKGDWESGRTNTIEVADAAPKVFTMFLSWLITGDVENLEEYTGIRSGSQDMAIVGTELETQWNLLAECFILGEFLLATNFKNAVIDTMVAKSKELWEEHGWAAGLSSDQLKNVHEGTGYDSPLRLLLLDTLLISGVETIIDDLDSSMPEVQEFLKDVAKRSISKLNDSYAECAPLTHLRYPWSKDPCNYHQHPDKTEEFSCTQD